MSKKIIFISFLYLFSCTYLPNSAGQIDDIIIIASPEDKILLEPFLDFVFDGFINTPQEEKLFNLIYQDPLKFMEYKKNMNIIIASLDFPYDTTGDLLINRFKETYVDQGNFFQLKNLYSKEQIITVINAVDAIHFEKLLKKNKKWLSSEINDFIDSIMHERVFRNGKNTTLSKNILQILGISIDLQIDYKEIKMDSLNSFIWIGRGYPYRWISMYKADKLNYSTVDNSFNQFETDIKIFMPSVNITKHFRKNETKVINNNSIKIIRGIYEHKESETGGPFVVYMIDIKDSNELILINGFVNHPGHKKLLLLKEIEIMFQTIYYGDKI